jgi:hypothetical protein
MFNRVDNYIKTKSRVYEFLLKAHKNLNKYELDSFNFFFLFVLFRFYFLKDIFLTSKYNILLSSKPEKFLSSIDQFKKFFYLLSYLYFIKCNDNLIFKKVYIRFFMSLYSNYMKLKDSGVFINLETHCDRVNFYEMRFDYFFLDPKLDVYLYDDYFFRIDFYNFIVNREYTEYLRKFMYNEYLSATPLLYKYPLMKKFLRFL